jgi:protein SCO1/2
MQAAETAQVSEAEFAALVDAVAADAGRHGELTALLREDHPLYDERGAATVVRMRGWVLTALARVGVPDAALIFVLEELDAGVDPYLVAAAARALRAYPHPNETLAPFVMRALNTVRYRDEPVSFAAYGEYALATDTSAVRELVATLAWLGPRARAVLPELDALRAQARGRLRIDIDRALQAIRRAPPASCCAPSAEPANVTSLAPEARRDSAPLAALMFEDHDGAAISYADFFRGRPVIAVFFYTRCDNPLKCSLTVTKLARMQKLLQAQGLAGRIRTAAITYDPAFDRPERLRVYGKDRDVQLGEHHRMLRARDDDDTLRRHFALGVNFVESLVNRHRVEAYILDAQGRIAVSFERLLWDEQQVVARAVDLLHEGPG